MSLSPSARQRHILDLLDASPSLTIRELAAELSVSAMTVHRDLNRLADGGQLLKTRGGATLPARDYSNVGAAGSCAMCNRLVPERSAVILQSRQRGRQAACCPHCGLALFELDAAAGLMLVTDFLNGRMLSAHDASYLLGSDVPSCCTPGILAFAGRHNAERFQLGFGGEIMDLMQLRRHLRPQVTVVDGPER